MPRLNENEKNREDWKLRGRQLNAFAYELYTEGYIAFVDIYSTIFHSESRLELVFFLLVQNMQLVLKGTWRFFRSFRQENRFKLVDFYV